MGLLMGSRWWSFAFWDNYTHNLTLWYSIYKFFFKKRSLLCIFKTIFSNMGPTTSISTILPGAFLSFKTSSKRYTKNKKQTKQRLYVMHYIKYIFTTEALVWIVSRKIWHLSVGTQTYDNGKKFWIKQNDAFNGLQSHMSHYVWCYLSVWLYKG